MLVSRISPAPSASIFLRPFDRVEPGRLAAAVGEHLPAVADALGSIATTMHWLP
jgi:hypothetical protein